MQSDRGEAISRSCIYHVSYVHMLMMIAVCWHDQCFAAAQSWHAIPAHCFSGWIQSLFALEILVAQPWATDVINRMWSCRAPEASLMLMSFSKCMPGNDYTWDLRKKKKNRILVFGFYISLKGVQWSANFKHFDKSIGFRKPLLKGSN